MKIYLAGRITGADWRNDLVKDLPAEPPMGYGEFFPLPNAILGVHDYVGPFYVLHDPGEYDDCTSPGHRADYQHPHNIEPAQESINEACLKAIHNCDVFFAWIDATDLYGTLVEIGYARALNKEVWIASPKPLDELWFAYRTAKQSTTGESAPRNAFLSLSLDASLSAYPYFSRYGYVYVLKAGPFYKIGRAKILDSRIRQVKLQLPFNVELVHAIETWDNVALEQSLHEVFHGYRCNGEWFQLGDNDAQWLCKIEHLTPSDTNLPF